MLLEVSFNVRDVELRWHSVPTKTFVSAAHVNAKDLREDIVGGKRRKQRMRCVVSVTSVMYV
jgi:hypothetical protein